MTPPEGLSPQASPPVPPVPGHPRWGNRTSGSSGRANPHLPAENCRGLLPHRCVRGAGPRRPLVAARGRRTRIPRLRRGRVHGNLP